MAMPGTGAGPTGRLRLVFGVADGGTGTTWAKRPVPVEPALPPLPDAAAGKRLTARKPDTHRGALATNQFGAPPVSLCDRPHDR
jgi:hypothetical protein